MTMLFCLHLLFELQLCETLCLVANANESGIIYYACKVVDL